MSKDRQRTIRVLAADDSAVMRGVLRTMFQFHGTDGDGSLPPMELCGAVRDGVECLDAVARLQPDAILLDLEMPRLDGLGVLRRLRELGTEIPVIMCSAYTERGARSTLDALSLGAKDYVMKPSSASDFAAALDTLMQQVLPKIAALAGGQGLHAAGPRQGIAASPAVARPEAGSRVEVVVIGVSTGGPSALERMLPRLAADLPVPVLIVQHMPKLFTGALADRLNRLCVLPVREAHDGALLEPGTIWLAPGDTHMELARIKQDTCSCAVKLHRKPPLNHCMPSVDYLFSSAARTHGAGVLALMMTGMGSDGLDGAGEIKRAGGTVLAQDEASSAVWGMPGRVVEAGFASQTLPLDALANAIMERVQLTKTNPRRPVAAEQGKIDRRPEVTYGVL